MFVCYAVAVVWSKNSGSNLRGAVLLQGNSVMCRFLWKAGNKGDLDNLSNIASTEGI